MADAGLEDQYVASVCRRATGTNSCPDWDVFVTAGMNDLDQRCDGYLAWLDDRRRSVAPILQQINDSSTAASAILFATGAGTEAMAIATAAFGFASGSFTNFNSRLLYEVDHTTVQSIVLGSQTRFRVDIRTKRITNRPDAIYALRQYLRICMPFTIETEINNTLTAFSSGGAEALAIRPPLVGTPALVPALAPEPAGPRTSVRPRGIVIPPVTPDNPLYDLLADPRSPEDQKMVRSALAALCVEPREVTRRNKAEAMGRIKVFQDYLRPSNTKLVPAIDGKLTRAQITFVAAKGSCDTSAFHNYYERDGLRGGGVMSPSTIQLLHDRLADDPKLVQGADESIVRSAIARARLKYQDQLTLHDPTVTDQFSRDLFQAMAE